MGYMQSTQVNDDGYATRASLIRVNQLCSIPQQQHVIRCAKHAGLGR